MGRAQRERPKYLAKKLKAIRRELGYSQSEMLQVVEPRLDKNYRSYISEYESGEREPSLLALLRYAKCVGVTIDTLVDDKVKLPENLIRKSN